LSYFPLAADLHLSELVVSYSCTNNNTTTTTTTTNTNRKERVRPLFLSFDDMMDAWEEERALHPEMPTKPEVVTSSSSRQFKVRGGRGGGAKDGLMTEIP
jgi:hypothetical protein